MGSRSAGNCPPGTFNGRTGGKSRYDCNACTAGKYCQGTANPAPDGDCSAGYYCPARSQTSTQYTTLPGYYSKAGAAEPTKCAKGTYGPYTAIGDVTTVGRDHKADCLPCMAGFYCPDEGMSDTYKDCPKGHYCPAGSSKVKPCKAGTYTNELNRVSETDCKPCSPGSFCATTGLVEPTARCE